MADIFYTDAGIHELLRTYFNNYRPSGGNNHTLHLFSTDVTPAEGVTYVETAGGGYAAKTLTNGSWTASGLSNPRDIVYAAQTFTFTGALSTNPNIYGYFVKDADGTVLYAQRLDNYFTPLSSGDYLIVTPKVAASYGTPV